MLLSLTSLLSIINQSCAIDLSHGFPHPHNDDIPDSLLMPHGSEEVEVMEVITPPKDRQSFGSCSRTRLYIDTITGYLMDPIFIILISVIN